MAYFTSYYARSRAFDPSRFLLVSISRGVPAGWFGYHVWEFAPSSSILYQYRDNLDDATYMLRYKNEVLNNRDILSILRRIQIVANGRDIVFMCFEGPDKFCHRHLLAAYLNFHYNLGVSEFQFS